MVINTIYYLKIFEYFILFSNNEVSEPALIFSVYLFWRQSCSFIRYLSSSSSHFVTIYIFIVTLYCLWICNFTIATSTVLKKVYYHYCHIIRAYTIFLPHFFKCCWTYFVKQFMIYILYFF